MSTAPRREERSISNDNIVLSYSSGRQLYLIFREAIDDDMPPLAADFTVVDRARPVPVRDIAVFPTDTATVVVLQLKDRIRPGHEVGVRYRPTQWIMCWQASGDSVDEFEQPIYPEGSNAVDLTAFGTPDFDEDEDGVNEREVEGVAAAGLASDYRIQVRFNPGIDTSTPVQADDFRAEMHDRWLRISAVKYDEIVDGAAHEVVISLSEPLDVGSVVHLAYKSPNRNLRTFDGAAVAPFVLEAQVRESTQSALRDGELEPAALPTLHSEGNQPVAASENLDELDVVLRLASESDVPKAQGLPSRKEVDGLVKAHFKTDAAEQASQAEKPLASAAEVKAQSKNTPPAASQSSAANDAQSSGAKAAADAKKASTMEKAESAEAKKKAQEEEKVIRRIVSSDLSTRTPTIPGGGVAKSIAKKPLNTSPSVSNKAAQKKDAEGSAQVSVAETGKKAIAGLASSALSALKKKPQSQTQSQAKAPAKKGMKLLQMAFMGWLVFAVVIYAGMLVFDIDMPEIGAEKVAGTSSHAAPPVKAQANAQVSNSEACEVTAEDGGVYKGQCVNGKFEGNGVYSWPSGNSYDGQWQNGKQHGVGKLTYNNGAVYTGEFANGVEHGKGLMRWPNGSSYEGGYDKGIFHGQGEYRSVDGTRYVGKFEKGMMSQEGTCFMKNGNQTQGPCGQRGRR